MQNGNFNLVKRSERGQDARENSINNQEKNDGITKKQASNFQRSTHKRRRNGFSVKTNGLAEKFVASAAISPRVKRSQGE